jgi:hypothetical protein
MRTKLSAYKEVQYSIRSDGKGCSSPQALAQRIRPLRDSITNRKIMGGTGSPYHRPLPWHILSPSTPLSNTLVLAVESRCDTQFIHRAGKPTCYKTSSKNNQATKSKAWAMLTLTSREGHFLAWSSLAVPCSTLKLSYMNRPSTNALWLTWIISPSLEANRLASSLEKSFPRT